MTHQVNGEKNSSDMLEKEAFLSEVEKKRSGLVSEYLEFLAANKKWWLLPIIVLIFLVGLLIVLGGTVLAPFIYPLF